LEALKGKMVISGDYGKWLESLEWLEGLGAKDRGSCKVWEFFRDFGGFFECLEWLGPTCKYFAEVDGPAVKFANA
jgi:hypothetical protein